MDLAGFGLRDVILAVVGLVGVYVAVMVLRLMQVGKRKHAPIEPLSEEEAEALAAADSDDDEAGEEALTYARPTPAVPAPAPAPAGNVRSFNAELNRSQLEREVKQLRDEVAALRAELDGIKATSRVSPQYADAMALIQRGMTAQDVADRCNISLAEAELVWALSRGPQQFEEEDDDGFDSGRRTARFA